LKIITNIYFIIFRKLGVHLNVLLASNFSSPEVQSRQKYILKSWLANAGESGRGKMSDSSKRSGITSTNAGGELRKVELLTLRDC
jgi:hypothetical protein